jgi:pyrroloquinoline quinone biosynthesis protein B
LLKFKLLGTAAGGGIPQWNCACASCELSRTRPEIAPPRMQLQAILSNDGHEWILINASPDLRFQIEANPELQPSATLGKRSTPIQSIILTSADLDQVLGLLLLREFQPLHIYSTSLVRQILEANTFFRMLQRIPNQLTWTTIQPRTPFQLGGVACTPISLPASPPYYAREFNTSAAAEASIGLLIESEEVRIAYTPSLPEITEELLEIYDSCDVVLVDGTFWSDAELSQNQSGTPMARAIGHIPMSGIDGTIARLAKIAAPRKIFIHLNNTNPVLDPRSAEYKQVSDAGWQIGHDGWQLN